MNKQNKINAWLLASRPKTLLAAFVPVMVGSALAIKEGSFHLSYSIVALLCSVLIQIGTNFTNDLFDFFKGADNDSRKGPTRVIASNLISLKEMKIGILLTFLSAFILGLYLVSVGGIIILIFGILSILAGLAYTAGPFPLAYNGLGDLFVFMFFGVIGTTGTFYVQTSDISLLSILSSLPVGALITNILVVNNYRDINEDKSAGKNTLAVLFGKNFTRYQYITMLVISFLIPMILFLYFNLKTWIFLPYLTIPIAVRLVFMLYNFEGPELNKTLELTAKFSAIFGILFSFGFIL